MDFSDLGDATRLHSRKNLSLREDPPSLNWVPETAFKIVYAPKRKAKTASKLRMIFLKSRMPVFEGPFIEADKWALKMPVRFISISHSNQNAATYAKSSLIVESSNFHASIITETQS